MFCARRARVRTFWVVTLALARAITYMYIVLESRARVFDLFPRRYILCIVLACTKVGVVRCRSVAGSVGASVNGLPHQHAVRQHHQLLSEPNVVVVFNHRRAQIAITNVYYNQHASLSLFHSTRLHVCARLLSIAQRELARKLCVCVANVRAHYARNMLHTMLCLYLCSCVDV